MKPTKKKPAKRAVRTGSIEHKLMKLRNRIDEKQTSKTKHTDKQWVETLIDNVRVGGSITQERMLRANNLWRTYA